MCEAVAVLMLQAPSAHKAISMSAAGTLVPSMPSLDPEHKDLPKAAAI